MDNQGGVGRSWPPSIRRMSRVLRRLDRDFVPVQFDADLTDRLLHELDVDEKAHESILPMIVYDKEDPDPGVVLWPLSTN